MPTPTLNLQKAIDARAKASSLQETINTVGWREVLVPELQALRAGYLSLLVPAVLSAVPTNPSAMELAARISSIDELMDHVSTIIRVGDRASQAIDTYKPSNPTPSSV